MKIEELKDEEMYVLCAPDGSIQLTTMAPDFQSCIAMCELLGRSNISQPLTKMFEQGFCIMPVKITVVQNGTEAEGYKKSKALLK